MDIYKLVRGSLYTEYINFAIKIRFFDKVHARPEGATIDQISEQIPTVPVPILTALAETLVTLNCLQRQNPEGYTINPLSVSYLVSEQPNFIEKSVDLQQQIDLPLLQQGIEKILTGKAEWFSPAEKKPSALTPDELKNLGEIKINDGEYLSMTARSGGEELSQYDVFTRLNSIIDLGGNDGSFLIPLLKKNLHLHGTILDLPALQTRAEENIQNASMKERLTFRSFNFFSDVFPAADAYLCGFVLHDWGRPEGYHLLARIFEVLPSKGLFILHENLLDDPNKAEVVWSLQLQYLLRGTEGRLRTSIEYKKWLEDTGFRVLDLKFGSGKSFIFAEKP